jgi:hypothetical protein
MIRLIEALLQIGKLVSNWRVRHLREAILTKVGIAADRYCLNQLSYSPYRLRANGLSPHEAKRQTRRLTERGAKVGFSFIIFQTTLRLQRRELSSSSSVATSRLSNELESAFHKSDFSLQSIIRLFKAEPFYYSRRLEFGPVLLITNEEVRIYA